MAKYKPQHSRLLFIDKAIRENSFPNCSSLAAGYEVSVRTIQRDLDYMRHELGAPLEYSFKNHGFYYTEASFQLPAIDLSEKDLFAIYLADKLLAQYHGTPIYERLSMVFQKIEDALPGAKIFPADNEQSFFTVLTPNVTEIPPDILETVFDCLRSSIQLKIEYRSPGCHASTRVIDPYHAVRFEGDWYLIGHCDLRRNIRTFSMARIISAERMEGRFTIPESFDFKRYTGSHFGVHWGPDNIFVRILFTGEAAPYVVERKWHPSQRIEFNADGAIVLSLTVNHLLELKRWILSWGNGAVVLEPADLARDLQQTVHLMAGAYRIFNGKI